MLKTIDFPNGTRVLSYAELSPEQIKLIEEALIIGKRFGAKCDELNKTLPNKYYGMFYGNYDLYLIREHEHGPED